MPLLGSLFAGIGGFELGFERAEIRTVWQVEIDEWCQKILAKHFPQAQRFTDIRSVGTHCLAPVDIVSAGFPCSDISQAGRRRGIAEGTQSGLWKEALRVVRELRPRYVVLENVARLARAGLALVLGDLCQAGFDAEWTVISARDFGLPHLRQRLFVVAYPPWPGETEGPQVFKHEWRPKLADSAGVGLLEASVFAEGPGEQETVRGGEQAGRRVGNPGDGGCGVQQLAHAHDGGRVRAKDRLERGGAGESTYRGLQRQAGGTRVFQLDDAEGGGRLDAEVQRRVSGEMDEAAAGSPRDRWVLRQYRGRSGRVWLAPEQSFEPVAHELPEELARLKACGNAVVPAATEWVARRILKREAELAKR
jgi:site-specific DNA-cytosine methylase